MNLTILLDLDDTLLSNNMETFVPHYLKALSQHINTVSPENLAQAIMAGTQLMIAKQEAAHTLEQVFDDYFYEAIGTSKEATREKVDYFYEFVFPTLQTFTHARPDAIRLVQDLLTMGQRVAIATNPVFPKAATYHRLRWANLAPEDNTFELISTYEDFHFTKSNPAYYAEILAQLGWPEEPAVMIGDAWEEDMRTASMFGLPVFWVTETPGKLPEEAHPASSQGSLADVIPWLETITPSTYELDCSQPETLLAILRSTPAALETITLTQPKHLWTVSPSDDEWSLNEIICHLRDVDQDVNLGRFDQITKEENPFIVSVDSDSWNSERSYNRQDGFQALNDWFQSRTSLIKIIENLPPSVWQKTVRHTIFGPTTVAELVSFIATHDQNHIRQACSVIRSLNLTK